MVVVTDDDRDGVPDWRYGIDNMPVGVADQALAPHRGWREILHTGQTECRPGACVVGSFLGR